ncbi:NUDIX domain-containing protein [Pseudorhodobacter sp. MZDSW-24AT]|uniref:NUDIX domain-containing protein n=1 Tax=Pseudorhodobacter sp. MZDSW-24AT TaxID=2052957 RepID=UPI000C1F2B1C|nr:NUDIX domain-containing protein [Pseudorhodobacter sp. MZDSW-24AT]PJF10521.1 tellurium resistance protein [Pseudorhodobacter sp. MZDSW-24AT]
MSLVFLCGPLCHRPLLAAILGPDLAEALSFDPASARGQAAHLVDAPGACALRPCPGAQVDGALVAMPPEAAARLAFYARALGLVRRRLQARTAQGRHPAIAYSLPAAESAGAPPWDADLWRADHAALAVETATEVMGAMGHLSPARVQARLGPLMVRAASRLRARTGPAPHALRRAPDTIVVHARRQPYAQFFAVEEYDLSFRRFDGRMSPVVTRAAFISGDAVTVLPYDPIRDRVLLVEQMRVAPFVRGDRHPWQLEAIAGRIDPGETPEAAARREAVEESGLTLGALLPVANTYPSPGAKTEFLYSYVALTDLPDGSAGVFGVAHEAEDIRGHLIGLDQALALVDSGEIATAPLVLTLFWLHRERARLKAQG